MEKQNVSSTEIYLLNQPSISFLGCGSLCFNDRGAEVTFVFGRGFDRIEFIEELKNVCEKELAKHQKIREKGIAETTETPTQATKPLVGS